MGCSIMFVLEMDSITKKFLAVTALDNVSLNLKPGEIHAICGENGAGKSTLMKILSGSYPYSEFEGIIKIDGHQVCFHSTKDAEKKGIEMIYQEISLHLDLSVAENIFLGNLPQDRLKMVDWKKTNEMARSALAIVGLEVEPTRKVRSLSTSQQQLLAIARSISRNPKVLVLDEPTSALTQAETDNLMNILRKLKIQGVSCLYISHKLKEVFEIADRITVIRDGQYISTYEAGATTYEKLIEDMVGRKIENLYPKVPSAKDEVLLEIKNIYVPHPYMKDKNIVDGVSFQLHKGEVLALAGLVGAGRTELLDAIFRVGTTGVCGEILLEGKPIKGKTPKDMKDAGIGYVTENRKTSGFVANMSLMKNITLASLGKISGRLFLSKSLEKENAQKYSNKLQIKAPDIFTQVLNLSGGNQQKVVLAKWMMTNMKVLLLDEPTRGIDVGAKAEIYKLINELSAQGIGIIMVSSEMPELIAMCDRFLVLSGGKIRAEFTKEEVSQEKIMRAATFA